jgi:hypothetical protein
LEDYFEAKRKQIIESDASSISVLESLRGAKEKRTIFESFKNKQYR